ncbi:hypothetical protein IFM89_003389 [Coptis chinensis]|uniref:Uncharacterized protein n=1 Tax=Coptis chinensis TaxID=261450 RepID=A0A835ITY7_9MAGN|nr:hypothetical protein IFM89_003389 [Coptis chinensis]
MDASSSSSWSCALVSMSPYTFSALGIAISIGVSILVAAFSLNHFQESHQYPFVFSVIFCEAAAIYGVIVAIIPKQSLKVCLHPKYMHPNLSELDIQCLPQESSWALQTLSAGVLLPLPPSLRTSF